MKPVLFLVKTSLKQFWDIDPILVDSLLVSARMQATAGWYSLSQGPALAGRIFRAAVQGVSTELQALTA